MKKEAISVLFNPAAGEGRALRFLSPLKERLAHLGLTHEIILTRSEAHLRSLCRELASSSRLIVGVGGDSTFHIMANEIIVSGSQPALGMIGVGSSNDIPREFNLDSLEAACQALRQGFIRPIDVGAIIQAGRTVRYVLGQVNLGLGVSVNEFVASHSRRQAFNLRWQSLLGLRGIISAWNRREVPLPLAIETNRTVYSGFFISAVFSNIRFWATGRQIAPAASPDDGRFDLCLIRSCSLARLLWLAFASKKGKHVQDRAVSLDQAEIFRISSVQPFRLQTDGEILGETEKPLEFNSVELKVIPRALKIITLPREIPSS